MIEIEEAEQAMVDELGDGAPMNGDALGDEVEEDHIEGDHPEGPGLDDLQRLVDQQREVIAEMKEEKQNYARDRAEMMRQWEEMKQEKENLMKTMTEAETRIAEAQTRVQQHTRPTPKAGYKAPKYDGETEWSSFLVQFEAWLRLSNYEEKDPIQQKTCCDLLGLSLEGDARTMFSSLAVEDRSSYELLKKKLQDRYGGERTAEVFKAKLLGGRKRQPGEVISKIRDDLQLMAKKAYPHLPLMAQEQIAVDALLRSVDNDLRLQCTMQKCKTLDEVVAVIESYEAVVQQEEDKKKRGVRMVATSEDGHEDKQGSSEDNLCQTVSKLSALVERQDKLLQQLSEKQKDGNWRSRKSGKFQNSKGQRKVARDECFRCGQKGHFIRDCPQQTETADSQGNGNPPSSL